MYQYFINKQKNRKLITKTPTNILIFLINEKTNSTLLQAKSFFFKLTKI